jgi:hypothetical protein
MTSISSTTSAFQYTKEWLQKNISWQGAIGQRLSSLPLFYSTASEMIRELGVQLKEETLEHRKDCSHFTAVYNDLFCQSSLHTAYALTKKDSFSLRSGEKITFPKKLIDMAKELIIKITKFFCFIKNCKSYDEKTKKLIKEKTSSLVELIVKFEQTYKQISININTKAMQIYRNIFQMEALLSQKEEIEGLLDPQQIYDSELNLLNNIQTLNNWRRNSEKTVFDLNTFTTAKKLATGLILPETELDLFFAKKLFESYKKLRIEIKKSLQAENLHSIDVNDYAELSLALEDFESNWKNFCEIQKNLELAPLLKLSSSILTQAYEANLFSEEDLQSQDPDILIKIHFLIFFRSFFRQSQETDRTYCLYSPEELKKLEKYASFSMEEQNNLLMLALKDEPIFDKDQKDLVKEIKSISAKQFSTERKKSSFIIKHSLNITLN